MKLTNLSKIHNYIRNQNQTYGIFEFSKNRKIFDIFFDVSSTPYRLGFLLIKNRFELWLDVLPGYLIDERLSKENYYNLVNILELKSDPNNKFSPFAFFTSFNECIPSTLVKIPRKKRNEIFLQASKDMKKR